MKTLLNNVNHRRQLLFVAALQLAVAYALVVL